MPTGTPMITTLVSMLMLLPEIVSTKWSSPRGAGPPCFSPTRLYFEPWHGHSNHWDCWQYGTRHPRWTHRWYRAMSGTPSTR